MSAELYTASQPAENNGSLQTTTVGGSKPLHRFLKGQPKIMGTVVLIIGASFFILSIAISTGHFAHHIWTTIPPGFLLGTLFIISGILFIVTELNPTKKTVTISLALSIVSILGACWTVLHILPDLHFLRSSAYFDENITDTELAWANYSEAMGVTVEALFLFYSFVGAIIFIVMSVLAGAALRSTKSQAVVVMTTTSTTTPAE
ncbi:uncharacterized protein LOC121643363 [Melanotaenia boesemani]|uniref:uncharacterized protein LOC121643363 n=1 Tax=Melanotaenia boesemani TaxID=1250792 RepID=UPI001C03D3C7|nr:uncharacterized protein LOC121643363 [Melanotaenia boesemani]XP_041846681.1 uncharacterized protein LOC121643363 [Melanotaenia boesemani]